MLTAVEASIAADSCEAIEARQWRVRWRVTNFGQYPLHIDDAWVPHGRFRGDGHVPFNLTISAGESGVVELNVTASEPPGTVVENAFLILRAGSSRLFARMRIEFDAAGMPTPIVESVTAQPHSSSRTV